MEQTRKTLLFQLYGYLSIMVLILVLFETNMILAGTLVGSNSLIYMQFVMQFLTLMTIPFALYLFKIKNIERSITNKQSTKGFWCGKCSYGSALCSNYHQYFAVLRLWRRSWILLFGFNSAY